MLVIAGGLGLVSDFDRKFAKKYHSFRAGVNIINIGLGTAFIRANELQWRLTQERSQALVSHQDIFGGALLSTAFFGITSGLGYMVTTGRNLKHINGIVQFGTRSLGVYNGYVLSGLLMSFTTSYRGGTLSAQTTALGTARRMYTTFEESESVVESESRTTKSDSEYNQEEKEKNRRYRGSSKEYKVKYTPPKIMNIKPSTQNLLSVIPEE